MTETYTDSAATPDPVRASTGSDANRQEYVLRLDRNTLFVAAAAFLVGVLVGFVLD